MSQFESTQIISTILSLGDFILIDLEDNSKLFHLKFTCANISVKLASLNKFLFQAAIQEFLMKLKFSDMSNLNVKWTEFTPILR